MSQIPTITRADLVISIGARRLDALLHEPFEPDEPDLAVQLDTRLSWALEMGVAELALYIDLAKYEELSTLYHCYAVFFAVYHLQSSTSAGAPQASLDTYNLMHKNLAMAHKSERLPGEREQRSTTTAVVIEDDTQWSANRMKGFE